MGYDIQAVLERIAVEKRIKNRIAKDLRAHINEACRNDDLSLVLSRMGTAVSFWQLTVAERLVGHCSMCECGSANVGGKICLTA